MIWSVSTSARSSTLTGPDTMRTGSISGTSPRGRGLAAAPGPDVDEVALDGGRRGHLGRDQVGAPAAALPALEVAVRGGRAALARGEDVGVHSEAHGAPGGAPVEARGAEHAVEALGLRLRAPLLRAGHDHRAHVRGDRPALHHAGGGAQVAD